VVLPGVLRQYSGGAASVDVDTGEGATLAEVLDGLAATAPALTRRIRDERGELRRYVNVYVDGEDVRTRDGLDTPVANGSTVILLPAMAGGS
jgi:molybdopterin converting factor small subunit